MAIREGVHAIEKIRISGVGGDQEFDHVITWVWDSCLLPASGGSKSNAQAEST